MIMAFGKLHKNDDMIRLPWAAGAFYPKSPERLASDVCHYLDAADPAVIDGELMGIIVPHAGYTYSGTVAAHAYKLLAHRSYDTVIMIGLSHRYPVAGAAVYARGRFRTSLGDIEIDEELAAAIIESAECAADIPQAHAQEHSLEVQLPFLQTIMPDCRIVPILIQQDDKQLIAALSANLAKVIKSRSVLLLGSTDLCHYPTYDEAVKSDRVIVNAIEKFDTQILRDEIRDYMSAHVVQDLHCMMCSTGAVYTTMETARALGANRISVVKAANSGDVPGGQHDQVVGYVAAVIYRQ